MSGRKGSAPERPTRRRRGRRRFSILLAIAVVFAVSAVLRLAQIGDPFAVRQAIAAGGAAGGLAGPDAPLRAALDEVERLRADLVRREQIIVDRERAMEAAQTLVTERLAALEAVEARLTDLMALSDVAAETDIDRLTRVYETMEPEAAAPLFAQMEPSFAAGFLSRMSPAASAALMSELEPRTAYAISVVLATRNAGAPTRADAETGN